MRSFYKIECKVTLFFGRMQIFLYFCSRFYHLGMKARIILYLLFLIAPYTIGATHIHISDPDTWNAQELAPYIGQTIIFDVPIVVCSNANGSYTVSPRRFYTPTNQAYPRSSAYTSIMTLNSTASMLLEGVYGYHRCGEKIYNLCVRVNSTSKLTWVSGEWRGNSRKDLEQANVRQMVNIEDCEDCLLVCTANLEYYLAANTGSGSMGPSSYSEHQIQRTKVNKALSFINADVYGLVEIESGQVALEEIAKDLNAKLPKRNYTYINDNSSPNGTYTKAGFIYDANVLEPIGKLQENDTKVENRKKMICFREKATGERFILSVNHFKAKSGNGGGPDSNQGDGQGSFNATRVEEAQSVVDQYKRYASALKEKDILIVGDLNAYAKEDPITRLASAGMIDLHRAFHADSSYSYMFGGLAGYLDHAISNNTLFPQVTGAAGVHINSDEDDYYTYDKSGDRSMFRYSDHDPVVIGLRLDSTLSYDPSPSINSYELLTGETNTLTIYNAVQGEKKGYYAIYNTSGWLIERKEIIDTQQQIETPLTPGIYIIHIYYDTQIYTRKVIIR